MRFIRICPLIISIVILSYALYGLWSDLLYIPTLRVSGNFGMVLTGVNRSGVSSFTAVLQQVSWYSFFLRKSQAKAHFTSAKTLKD